MNNFNALSSVRFTLNGIQYVRNYISAVYGNDIEVFNCYERKDVLVPRTHFSTFTVNNNTFTSAAALQSYILGVIYSRNSLGSGAIDQDNVDIKKHFNFTNGNTLAQVVQKVNALPGYTVTETQSVWFIGLGYITVQAANGINYQRQVSVVKYKLLNRGRGNFGLGGIQVTANDVELVYHNLAGIADVTGDPSTVIYPFTPVTAHPVSWLNTLGSPLVFQPRSAGLTLLHGTVNNTARAYVFTGEDGRYGEGALQATEEDFTEIYDDVPASLPTLQQIADAGGPLTAPLLIQDTLTGGKTSYLGLGKTYTAASGKVISTLYQEPLENVKYTIPAKKANDTFAMISDVKVQGIKYIDAEVVNTVYTIVASDFGKMLVYKGSTNITLLLSTNVTHETGSNLNFIQAGAGTITFATDGFIIKHALDEMPVTYGTNAIAGITIIDDFAVLIFGKLKPAV